MGYTHYWTQTKDFTAEEWARVSEDIGAILKDVQHVQGIPLSDAMGKRGKSPEFTKDRIAFNGVGDESHETMQITRKRVLREWQSPDRLGSDFCKTAREPYDLAVVAVLCYLATIANSHDVSSDGTGSDFLEGLAEARRALPRYANILDIPMGILKSDRWCGPWVDYPREQGYEVHCCVDGYGYVTKRGPKGVEEHYRFGSHRSLAIWLAANKEAEFSEGGKTRWGSYECIEPNIWNATGIFDEARHARIANGQIAKLKTLFPVPSEHAFAPPEYVRPDQFPRPESRAYYYQDLIMSLAKSA